MRGRAELALFAGAYLVYNAGRWATNGDVDRAQTNARRVIDFQGGSLRTRSPVRAAHAAASRRGRDDQDARARQHRRRRAHPLSDDLQRVILLDERGSVLVTSLSAAAWFWRYVARSSCRSRERASSRPQASAMRPSRIRKM